MASRVAVLSPVARQALVFGERADARRREVEESRDALRSATEDFEYQCEHANLDDMAVREHLVAFERDLNHELRWLEGLMGRWRRESNKAMLAYTMCKRQGRSVVQFVTVALRPRRACPGGGRPAARRTASSSRAGPDDPDSDSDPPSPRCPVGVAW